MVNMKKFISRVDKMFLAYFYEIFFIRNLFYQFQVIDYIAFNFYLQAPFTSRSINKKQFIKRSLTTIIQLNK
ncbi:hypothetical protein BpHYR1_015958 [Brachionus plicatilis]|uniref:Uncharacterized protein n=1 Tax=Brachionus plicatilis TaxID=10195 RepID=A0A3M7PMS1_BRAPC|nr:hypothetical protein BpHYR1_015958 [Brachionus plicatilis]